jgi:hypothetical protein
MIIVKLYALRLAKGKGWPDRGSIVNKISYSEKE